MARNEGVVITCVTNLQPGRFFFLGMQIRSRHTRRARSRSQSGWPLFFSLDLAGFPFRASRSPLHM